MVENISSVGRSLLVVNTYIRFLPVAQELPCALVCVGAFVGAYVCARVSGSDPTALAVGPQAPAALAAGRGERGEQP
ncbi:hypothetical protein EVAR_54016_1 [Eumeta japonica]|uniref:Uncharacterized protein n=1 Tax=Eumeta variegata TaxID=151549 RepID=A0A4C1XU51_EUMVA|nr:hypothetical protein EVAR_54016_1 [Eumeta japonica]